MKKTQLKKTAKTFKRESPYCDHCGVVDDLHNKMYCMILTKERKYLKQTYCSMVSTFSGQLCWISVEEELPEPNIFVLTAWKNGMFQVCRIVNGKWTTGATITHWMPIPDVP